MFEVNGIDIYDPNREPIKAVEYIDDEILKEFPEATAKHKFEIPYNGDPHLIDEISGDPMLSAYVKFFYMPCNHKHGGVTSPGDRFSDFSLEETNKIINNIQEHGFEPCILIQRGNDLDGMKYYVDKGIKYFTLGDDSLAYKAREEFGSDVYLTSSITNPITFEEYFKVEPGLYDMMILYYWYHRQIEHIKHLPEWNHYGLLINNLCMAACPWAHSHWFPETYGHREFNCNLFRSKFDEEGRKSFNISNIAVIPPQDIHLFEDYISTYKIVDRMYSTAKIVGEFRSSIIGNRELWWFEDESLGEKNYQLEPFSHEPNSMDYIMESVRLSKRLNQGERINDDEINRIVNHKNWMIRLAAADFGYGLDKLVHDKNSIVRASVANKCYGLDELVNDKSHIVRKAVAITGNHLDKLIDDESCEVRAIVADKDYGVDKLYLDKASNVRAMVAERGHYLDSLIDDEDKFVVCAVLRRGYYLDKYDLDDENIDNFIKNTIVEYLRRNGYSSIEDWKSKNPEKSYSNLE